MKAKLRGAMAGVVLDLGEAISFEEALEALQAVLSERRSFLTGARIVLDCGSLALSASELTSLLDQFEPLEMSVVAVESEQEEVRATVSSLALSLPSAPEHLGESKLAPLPADVTSPEIVESECGLVTGTVRSGHAVWHPGTVVIFGDVNPGAEIVAGGSVIVWGVLRGTVHAGAEGEDSVVVCALRLAPTQLRIGDCIARPPDDATGGSGPEIAYVQHDSIVVEPWGGQRHSILKPQPAALKAIRSVASRLRRAVRS